MNFDWIDSKLILDIFRNEKNLNQANLKVKNINISPASNKGDNYLATLVRVTATILSDDEQEIPCSYIVKTISGEATNGEFASEMNVFPKEQLMYGKFVPEFEAIWRSRAKVDIKFGPRCFQCMSEPDRVIVLEDLGFLTYKMGNRLVGLDYEHCKLVMQKLAKFHAASVIYNNSPENEFGEMFSAGLYSRTTKNLDEYYRIIFPYFVEAIEKLPGSEKYLRKINQWKDNSYQLICQSLDVDPNGFNVLNHGDLWLNNNMFAYAADGRVSDAMLIDFQMPFWGSPAYDLYYFITYSCQEDIRVDKFHDLVQCYHESLTEAFELLRFRGRVPSLKQLHMDLINRGFIATALVVEGLAGILMDEEIMIDKVMQMDADGDVYKRKMFNGARFLSAFEKYIPFLFARGSLEV